MRIAWLACLVPSIAIASPRPEVSVQGGFDSVTDPDPRATASEQGWDLEAEAGVRVKPWLSLLAFAGYARGPDYSVVAADTTVLTVTDAHRMYHEYGAKFRVHLADAQPLFFGAGIGLQQVDIANVQDMPSSHAMAVDSEISGVLVHLETGLEMRHLQFCHCSMYVVAAYVRGANIEVNSFSPCPVGADCGLQTNQVNPIAQPPPVQSLRLSVGMTWW